MLLNQKEILEHLGISYKKLKRLEKEGKIQVARISRKTVRYVVNEKEVNE